MIPLKDHYRILGIEPSATISEIKKAYRQLAHQFHPDKTNHDPYANAQFAAIKEAYETLTNPGKKEIYLQQRWYHQSLGKKKTQEPITPISILKQVLDLEKYVSRLDTHRMDKDGLYRYILDIIPDETISTVNSFNEKSVNNEIVGLLLRVSRSLTFSQSVSLIERLKKFNHDESITDKINHQANYVRNIKRWEQYKPWLLLLIVAIICILIFALAN